MPNADVPPLQPPEPPRIAYGYAWSQIGPVSISSTSARSRRAETSTCACMQIRPLTSSSATLVWVHAHIHYILASHTVRTPLESASAQPAPRPPPPEQHHGPNHQEKLRSRPARPRRPPLPITLPQMPERVKNGDPYWCQVRVTTPPMPHSKVGLLRFPLASPRDMKWWIERNEAALPPMPMDLQQPRMPASAKPAWSSRRQTSGSGLVESSAHSTFAAFRGQHADTSAVEVAGTGVAAGAPLHPHVEPAPAPHGRSSRPVSTSLGRSTPRTSNWPYSNKGGSGAGPEPELHYMAVVEVLEKQLTASP